MTRAQLEAELVESLVAECSAPRPLVLTTRWFRRNCGLGMRVWRANTRNFDYDVDIEHVEIGCPKYELTPNGPALKRKKKETE